MILDPPSAKYPGKHAWSVAAAFTLMHSGFVIARSPRYRSDERDRRNLRDLEKPGRTRNTQMPGSKLRWGIVPFSLWRPARSVCTDRTEWQRPPSLIFTGLTHRDRVMFPLRRRRLSLCVLGIAACLSGTVVAAQDTAGQDRSAEPSSVLTLHVVTNLVRIPVLVLTPQRERLSSPIASDRFTIQFSGGSPIRPKYVRREGDDPIDLALVVDTRLPQETLLPKIDEAIADLAPSYLRAGDRVSIYAIGCSKMNAVEDVPADRVQLKSAVDLALSSWTEHQRLKKKPPCSAETHLWDDLAYVASKLAKQPGWRAIVAVTDGDDRKSKLSPLELLNAAENGQVAIFGLDPVQEFGQGWLSTNSAATRLATLCESSGGMRLNLYQSSVARRMQQLMQMLRERYILEFPRPANLKPGDISMSVQIDHIKAFIRPAGDGVPLNDEAVTAQSEPIPEPSSAASQVEHNPKAGASPATEALPAEQSTTEPPVVQQPTPAVAIAIPPAAAPAAAPQPETPAQTTASTPLFKASARLTVEDVTVTDARHTPVHGLMQPDFLIAEDGKQQAIRNFEEYGTQRLSEQPAPPQLPADVYTNAKPPAPTTSAVNILLLDDVNSGLANHLASAPENVAYARQKSIKYLGYMTQGTQVAILQMGRALQVLQDFTSDKAVLLAAMKSASYKPVEGTFVTRGSDIGVACAAANLQSQLTINALAQVAAFLSGIKGRKNLIWFTPGTPWLFEYPAFSGVACLNDYTQQLHKAYALLTAAEIAVYPIDPRGLFGNPDQSAVFAGNLSPQAVAMQQAAFGGNTAEEHNSLRDIAEATGGVPFFDRNDLDAAMREAVQTGEDYYSLSYVPPLSKYDGKYHAIEVKVDRPNLHLQYRAGYTSVDPAKPPEFGGNSATKSESAPATKLPAAMGHGEAASTQLLFDVRVTPSTSPPRPGDPEVIGTLSPALTHRPVVRYDFFYSMAPDQIALVETPDGTRKGSVDFAFVAYDGAGQMLNFVGKTAELTLRPDQVSGFMKRPFQVTLQFDLPPGEVFVRLGVMDAASGKTGTLEFAEKVAK